MLVTGLRTYVTLASVEHGNAGVDLELFAVVDGETELLLLAGRGLEWKASPAGSNNWAGMTADDLAEMSRTCVGPDEPREGQSWAQAQDDHWGGLAEDLRIVRGVPATATQLRDAPHDIVFDRAMRRLLMETETYCGNADGS